MWSLTREQLGVLSSCTQQLRIGAPVEREGAVVTLNSNPSEEELGEDHGLVVVDLVLLKVAVNKERAEAARGALREMLSSYPNPERLFDGLSYVEVGAEMGDQGMALQLFAVGAVLGFWKIMTPAVLGITGLDARALAGMGMVMNTGYNDGN